jgi:archaellum component FlaC
MGIQVTCDECHNDILDDLENSDFVCCGDCFCKMENKVDSVEEQIDSLTKALKLAHDEIDGLSKKLEMSENEVERLTDEIKMMVANS